MMETVHLAAISRRSLGRMILALFSGAICPRRARASVTPLLQVDRFVDGFAGASAHTLSCAYRADAVIVLLSLPVFKRADVGSGLASLTEVTHQHCRYLSLRFAGASRPERAAGLDRVGSIREVVMERDAVACEAAYFGVLTSSPEETIEDGKRSLGKAAKEWNDYTAIDAHSCSGRTRSAVTRFRLQSPGGPNAHVIQEARANFQASHPNWRETQWPSDASGQAPPTFLYALVRAIRRPERITDSWYVYNERSYRLRIEKEPDRQQGLRLAQLGLTSRPESVLQVRGRIREEHSSRQVVFRIWIEEGLKNALPLRIEFQPRSYLRLAFEVDPKASITPLEENL
jgi:hypothetical protein